MLNHSIRQCCLVSLLLLTSCTSMRLEDFFASYVQQMQPVKNALLQGQFEQAKSLVPKQNISHNAYSLSLLEQGKIAFLQGNWQESEQLFSKVYQELEKEKLKAKVQISAGLKNTGAIISNDSAISYAIPHYEQSMLHSYQALNYLYQGKVESALVEIRRANLVQVNALKENENDIIKAQDEMASFGINARSIDSAYPPMTELIGEVKNGFQNAFTFYLSGVLYEVAGELNDAYIDYKKALEIFPDNPYLQKDILRLAYLLNMSDDLIKYQQQFSFQDKTQDTASSNTGQLVVLYEQNLVNAKQEATVNLPVFTRHDDIRFFNFSLPVYRFSGHMNQPLYLRNNQQMYTSAKIVQLQSLASKQLEEQLPSLVTRQALRLVAKEQMRRKMSKEGGDLGNILASLYNIASEHADTRSWLALPNQIDMMKIDLPEGQHSLALEHINGATHTDVTITKGRITLLHVTTLGRHTHLNTIDL